MKSLVFMLGLVLTSFAFAQECQAGFRPLDHALGTTCIPENPERIVSLTPMVTDDLLALGLEPAAIATFSGTDFSSYAYLEDRLTSVPIVGSFAEPNLETILQLKPDLIIGYDSGVEEIYTELSAIAPTIGIINQTTPEAWLELTAEAVNVDPQARLDAYNETMKDYREELSETVAGASAAFLRIQPDHVALYSSTRLGGPILYDKLGLEIPEVVAGIPEEGSYIELSLENLPELEGVDHIFLLDETEDGSPAQLLTGPLWQALAAVQAGNVHAVSRDIWINLGIIANEMVAKSIVNALK